MGLAAAELDQRLSAVDAAGLKIATEEDKQYLANILKMKDGVYTVTLEDGRPQQLADLQQEDFNKLIQAQKDGPKTLEDTAREQLRLDQIIKNDIAAIRAVVVGGILTAPTLQRLNETIRDLTMDIGQTISKEFSTEGVRVSSETLLGDLKKNISDIVTGGKFDPETVFSKLIEGQTENLAKLGKEGKEKIEKISEKISVRLLEEFTGVRTNASAGQPSPNNTGTNFPLNTNTGTITVLGQTGVNPNFNRGAFPTSPQKPIEIDGDIDVNVKFQNLPTSLTPEQIAEVIRQFNIAINEGSFKDYIINLNRGESAFGPNQMATF
jgi:hypothetical protein